MTDRAKEFRANLEILAEKLAADYKETGSTISWTDYETISDFLYRINEDLGGNPLYFDRATGIRDDRSNTIVVSTFVNGLSALGKTVVLDWDAPFLGFEELSDFLDLIVEYAEEAFSLQEQFKRAA
jgi:hypothetical protein